MSRKREARHTGFGVGITLLDFLLDSRAPRGVSQIAQHLDLPLSSTHDMLKTMNELGLVAQNPATRLYQLTPRVLELAQKVASHFGVNNRVHAALIAYCEKHQATACLAVIAGASTHICMAHGPHGGTVSLGSGGPVYATAAGKAIVSLLPETEWPSFAPTPDCPRLSKRTNLDAGKFYRELTVAREQGVAWNIMETTNDIVSAASPVAPPTGTATYSVALIYAGDRLPVLDRDGIATQVRDLAAELRPLIYPELLQVRRKKR